MSRSSPKIDADVDYRKYMRSYVQNRLLLTDAHIARGNRDREYAEENQLWDDAIEGNVLYETQSIFLKEFKLLEWLPQSPGLYHTPEADAERQLAMDYLVPNQPGVVFTPMGKGMMVVSGGVGCLRFTMKNVGGEDIQFLCATSSGIAHRGFLVGMRPEIYSGVAPYINNQGGVITNIQGEIRYWPVTEHSIPLHSHVKVPRMYLYAKKIDVSSEGLRDLNVTAAVTFRGIVDEREDNYFTYSHFDPTVPNSVENCVGWIRDKYVGELYRGKVLTDFDERYSHFRDAVFPLKTIMDPNLSANSISRISEDYGRSFHLEDDTPDFKLYFKRVSLGALRPE